MTKVKVPVYIGKVTRGPGRTRALPRSSNVRWESPKEKVEAKERVDERS